MEQYILEAVTRARTFFDAGHTKDIAFRQQQLIALKKAIIAAKETFLQALSNDLAKPSFESYGGELNIIMQELNHAVEELHAWGRPQPVRTLLLHFPTQSFLQPEPRGVVLIIGAWNYPLQLMLVPLIGAIAAGNCVILKPSEHAPHCSRAIAQLIAQTFASHYITVIEGGSEQAQQLLQHKFDYIFFTGSTTIGKIVMGEAAKQLTPITLELGGKNPAIVTETANLDCAAQRIVWGKFYNAGQNCISPDYLLVPTSLEHEFIQKLSAKITHFYGKDPHTSPDYARIINNHHLVRLQQLLTNGTIVVGGTIDTAINYMAPTLLTNVNLQSPLMQEEIFGPILPIIPYNTLKEAIAFINNRPQPLTIYFFSSSRHEQQTMLYRTQSGSLCMNDTLVQAASPYLPFGGVGTSGFGAYHGKKTFDTFTHYKSVITTSCRFDHGLRYPPYTKKHQWLQKIISIFGW